MKAILQKTRKITIGFLLVSLFLSNSLFSQIELRGHKTNTSTTSNITIDKPTGLQVGDVMLANIVQSDNDGDNLNNATSSGWTRIAGEKFGDSGNDEWWGTILYKVATASDVSASTFTFTGDNDANDTEGAIIAFYGVDNTGGVNGSPFDVVINDNAINSNNNSNSGALSATSLTTVSADAAIIMFGMLGNNYGLSSWNTTSPGSLTEIYDLPFNSDLDMGMGAAWKIKTTPGATSAGTATISNNARNGAILIALKKFCPPPTISTQPNALTICEGEELELSVTASNATSYQWKKDGNNIDGAITNSLSIPSATTANAGSYSVDVINSCLTIPSNAVLVTVKMIPVALGVTICQGEEGFLTSTTICPAGNPGTIGPNNAMTGTSVDGEGTIAWTNPNNISTNGSYATAVNIPWTVNSVVGISEYLQGTNYMFNIPNGSTINGISVTIRRQSSSNGGGNSVDDRDLYLLKSGSIVGSDYASSNDWPTSMATATYGGANDLWGTTWTAAEINASNFGVALSVLSESTQSNRTASVDYMRITVYYTGPNGTIEWYTTSSGGIAIGSGSSFNPVGVLNSGIPDANTIGTKIFYAECSNVAGCRTAVNFTINSKVNPTFTVINPICTGGNLSALPTNSNNGITGTWSPALNNMATTTYTFTPDVGQCAASTTMQIVVENNCSTIMQSSCGATLVNLNGYVYSTIVRYAQAYRWRVTNLATSEVQTADTPLRQFRVIMLPNFAYNTNYQVEVAVKIAGVWGAFSSPCPFSTGVPTTQMVDCVGTPATMTTQNACGIVPFAKGYRFEISNGLDVQTFDNTIRQFSLSQLNDIQPGTIYDVRVAVQNTDGVFMNYGPMCNVTSPGAATTRFSKTEFNNLNSDFDVKSYPNPFKNEFTININSVGKDQININVFDMTGRLIENRFVDSNSFYSISLGNSYQSGIYNVIVSQGQNIKTLRMIKR